MVLFSVFVFSLSIKGNAQVTLKGDAIDLGGGEYQLTPDIVDKKGAIWSKFRIDLTNDMDIQAELYLGDDDALVPPPLGADGMAFVLLDDCTYDPEGGPYFGQSISAGPSLSVEFDTYQNFGAHAGVDFNDPPEDHIAIQKDANWGHGAANPNQLFAPVTMSATSPNTEDRVYHDIRIRYDHAATLLTVDFDSVERVSLLIDIPADVFSGNTTVFWGFTAATGGLSNLQKVKINEVTLGVNVQDTTICSNAISPLTVDSVSAAIAFTWSPDDGSIDDVNSRAPVFTPTTTTTYTFSVADACEVGGFATQEFTVTVDDDCVEPPVPPVDPPVIIEVIIPTAFTPDGDGVNDNWNLAFMSSFVDAKVQVFNRLGVSVYESAGGVDYIAWTGEELPTASYFYVIELNDEEKTSHKGTVSIIR